MRRVPDSVLIPVLGFVLVLGAAVIVSASAGQSPAAHLHARASAYLQALSREDLGAVVAFHADPATGAVESERILALGGGTSFVVSLEVDDEVREGRVVVVWATAEHAEQIQEVLVWRRGEDDTWFLDSLDSRGPRQSRPPSPRDS